MIIEKKYGPQLDISREIHQLKYRSKGESFKEAMIRVADSLKDNEEHYLQFKEILLDQRFLPAGRVQAAMGAPREVTSFNCFVSGTLEDSMDSIMEKAAEAAQTMRLGGGIGYDFSSLRPRGDHIASLDSRSSGPISFMGIFDAICKTIASAGHRRGAQMGVLRVDHPDIEEFIKAKNNSTTLTQFNVSVGITDEFMDAVINDKMFDLKFEGKRYKTVRARYLWDEILRSTWDWAEPGVLFIDTINKKNNLGYCETIAATNPCLHPDTLIETVEGRVRIADIKEPTIVYTSMPDGSLGMARSTASWVSKTNAKVWRITTRNGKEIKVTADHKLLVHEKGWVKACDLTLGDRIVQLCRARRGSEYSGVKLTTENNRAYRMEHRMIAEAIYGDLGNTVVHHIDNNTYNNHIDNFEILTEEEHNRLTSSTTHPQEHQVHGVDGRFVATGVSPKRITPMPEHLKSNMKNNSSNAVVEIVPDFEVTDVYDLTVEGTHNMIGNFMVVHNCGEQPLPPYGACLLGSFNLVKYVEDHWEDEYEDEEVFFHKFNYDRLKHDIAPVVRAMDNVIDRTVYPLEEQRLEAQSKRRMGLGVTGVANAGEALGYTYGSPEFLEWLEEVMTVIRDTCYQSSISLALEKGPFPLFQADKYLESGFARTLPENIRRDLNNYGIRNSHLLSVAPTGTISLSADNVSSGIEPVFSHSYERTIQTFEGPKVERVEDYGYRVFGVKGKTANELSVFDHVKVLNTASRFVDSACSKTCNVGDEVTWDQFKDVYMQAYLGGASGCTTFRASGKRYGILNAAAVEDVAEEPEAEEDDFIEEGGACFFDPTTGLRTCE